MEQQLAKTTQIVLLAMLAFVSTAASCRREPRPPADQPKDPALSGLQPPPLNKPVHQPGDRRPAAAPQLPAGSASALIVVRDGRQFFGDVTVTGRVTAEANRIRIEPVNDRPIEILYRVPSTVRPPVAAPAQGDIRIVERSGPGGADRLVLVRLGTQLTLGEIWKRGPEPILVDLGDRLQLAQQPLSPTPSTVQSSYSEAPLNIVADGRVIARATLGQSTAVQTASGQYHVVVEVSHRFTPSDADKNQVEGGYILRAWVVRDS